MRTMQATRPVDPAVGPPPAAPEAAKPASSWRPALRRTPVAWILVVGGASTAVLIALASLDVGGQASVWDNGHWTTSIATAFFAALAARHASSGQDRRVRTWAALALGLWFAGQLVLDVTTALGVAAFPGPNDVLLLLSIVPLGGWVVASAPRTFDGGARWAALIDGATVCIGTVGIVTAAFGDSAAAIGGAPGLLMIMYATIALGSASAGLAILVGRFGVRRLPLGPTLTICGLAIVGISWLGWLRTAGAGLALGSGTSLNALFSIAFLVAAAGVVSRTATRARPVDSGSSALGVILPVLTAFGAAGVLLGLDTQLSPVAEPWVDRAVSGAIVLVVVRQTMLLRDRRAAVRRARAALAQAEAAIEQTRITTELLAAAQERFRRLVEQLPAMVYLDRIDPVSLTIVEQSYMSPRAEELTGFAEAELLADNGLWISRVVAEDRPAILEAWDHHCATGEPFSVSYRFARKDGSLVWLAEDATIIETGGQRFSQGMVVDVTERRETEARLRQAQKMEAVGQLAGGVAHDFNNLLTVITGHAGLLREVTPPDDPGLEDVEAIATAAASSADLVGQLLAFGRRTMLRPEVVDLSGVVSDVLPMLRRLLPEHIDVVTTLDDDLPAVRADPGQLQQVVLNLAINGRDAMPGGGSLRIATDARVVGAAEAARTLGLVEGRYVQLTIEDEGIGMDAATRDRIFEPFFTTKAAGRGTGLGLATVYGIVKQSGGYISLDSAPDRGSTFRVLLPATADAVQHQAGPFVGRPPSGRERIVLCEDEPAVRDLVAAVLRRSGYDVAVATTPTEALLLVGDRSSPADLLLTDVVMPGMSGPDVARRAKVLRPGLRVVLMSGYAPDNLDHEALGRPAAFLAKPFTPAALARTIRDVLDGVPMDASSGGPADGLADLAARR